MVELGQRLGLAGEPFGKRGVVAEPGGRIFSATKRSSSFCRALYTAPMPPRPISSMISSWGNFGASSSMAGGVKRWVLVPPAAVPVAIATFIRQAGHRPCGASAASGAWQFWQRFCVSIFCILPVTERIAGAVVTGFESQHEDSSARSPLPAPGTGGAFPPRPPPAWRPCWLLPPGSAGDSACAADARPRGRRFPCMPSSRRSRHSMRFPVGRERGPHRLHPGLLPSRRYSSSNRASTSSSNASAQPRSNRLSGVAVVCRFQPVTLLGRIIVQRKHALPAAAFLRLRFVPFVGHEMFHGREQKGAEPSALPVGLGHPVSLQQAGEELLRQILGIGRRAAATAGVGIERIPVGLAQVSQGVVGARGVAVPGRQHHRPMGGDKQRLGPVSV